MDVDSWPRGEVENNLVWPVRVLDHLQEKLSHTSYHQAARSYWHMGLHYFIIKKHSGAWSFTPVLNASLGLGVVSKVE